MRAQPSRRRIHIHYHRPPDRTKRFVQELLHDDGRVKVTLARRLEMSTPLLIEGQVALEDESDVVWFTFPGAWHDIGRFHRADGRLTGIYANILTPCVFEPGGDWETTDLFLDLWLPAGAGGGDPEPGTEPRLLDEDELRTAEAREWLEEKTATRARREAERLIELANAGRWPPPIVGEWTRLKALESLSPPGREPRTTGRGPDTHA